LRGPQQPDCPSARRVLEAGPGGHFKLGGRGRL